jgi:hypothetical protein
MVEVRVIPSGPSLILKRDRLTSAATAMRRVGKAGSRLTKLNSRIETKSPRQEHLHVSINLFLLSTVLHASYATLCPASLSYVPREVLHPLCAIAVSNVAHER